jgi:hypothetical protein
MTRKIIDCRDFPGPCTLTISGEEDEVVDAQTAHLAAVHEMADQPQVRAYVRSVLKDEALAARGAAS